MKLTTFLRRFIDGRCPGDKLPATLDLTGIRRTMKQLWNASIRDIATGVVLEYAATLVRNIEGKARLAYPVVGTAGNVEPNYDVAQDETFIGTFHTHPYENSLTGIAFSGGDIASAINETEWISLVQSGDDVFALIRTDKTVPSVDSNIVVNQVNDLYEDLLNIRLSHQSALRIANLQICATYGLAFYAGKISGILEVKFKP
jgi:hypothetical protein